MEGMDVGSDHATLDGKAPPPCEVRTTGRLRPLRPCGRTARCGAMIVTGVGTNYVDPTSR